MVWIKTNCGKVLRRWEYQTPHLSPEKRACRSRSNSLESDTEQWTGSKLGKAYDKPVCCHSAYVTYMQSSLGFAGGAYDTTLMAKSEEELKNLLIKVKEESEKAGLQLSIQKTEIMASGPITSWQIDGETVETVTDYFSGLQNHCRW